MQKKLTCVLLIDDDDATNFMNRITIASREITDHIEIKLNGKEAIEYLKCRQADHTCPQTMLIFLDINMPAMDGWEFLQDYKDLKISEKDKSVIVMLSTSSNPDDINRAERIPEVSEFENKPLQSEVLDRIMDKYFPG